MLRPAQFRPHPLPRGWPRRVRSAVVHVISLARTSLALTQGWASGSMNHQLLRQAEDDRLQQEIQLLREEIRIKDSRMEQLDAHRRPHYPPTARLAVLELRAARGWSLAQTASTFLLTPRLVEMQRQSALRLITSLQPVPVAVAPMPSVSPPLLG